MRHAVGTVRRTAPKPAIRLLITDLDNTLYDWVAWYARALMSMVARAGAIMGVSEEILLDELRDAFVDLGTVEQPRALLRLPCVQTAVGDHAVASERLAPALAAFEDPRAAPGALPGARETLARMRSAGVPVVGHTEAAAPNAVRRLRQVGLEEGLVALFAGPPVRRGPARTETEAPVDALAPAPPFEVTRLEPALHKPNPATVLEICRRRGVSPTEVLYVGDNLERDVDMALQAGAHAAWAAYGTRHDPDDWARLVRVTHWTPSEVQQAMQPPGRPSEDATGGPHSVILERSLAEVFDHFEFEATPDVLAEEA